MTTEHTLPNALRSDAEYLSKWADGRVQIICADLRAAAEILDEREAERANLSPPTTLYPVLDPDHDNLPVLTDDELDDWLDAEVIERMFGFRETIDWIRTWLDTHYPPDVFDGSSGDLGALTIAALREAVKMVPPDGDTDG